MLNEMSLGETLYQSPFGTGFTSKTGIRDRRVVSIKGWSFIYIETTETETGPLSAKLIFEWYYFP